MKFAVTATAIAALMLIATQGAKADEVTDSSCQAEFNARSPARHTCGYRRAEAVEDDKCKIRAICLNIEREEKGSIITVRYDHLHKLNNCDGRLKLGLC